MKKIIFHLMPMILLLLIGLISSCEKEEIQHDITPTGAIPLSATEAGKNVFDDDVLLGFIGKDSVFYQKVQEGKLINGDILVPDETITDEPITILPRSAYLYNLRKWTNKTVYYSFSAGLSSSIKNVFLEAAAEWNRVSNIRFVQRTNQSNYIYIINDGGKNYSYLGMIGGRQNLSLGANANVGTAIHEIGHALALIHEHQRPDRDYHLSLNNYVANHSDFRRENNSYTYGYFDWYSIMLYPSRLLPNGQWDIVQRINGQPFTSVVEYYGSYARPSTNDVNCIRYLYR